MSDKKFNTIWSRAQHIASPYMPEEHAQLLYKLALENPGTIVEIGSWHGRSSVILGNAVKCSGKGHLYCFDHWNLIEGAECIMRSYSQMWCMES
jgi:predicted O-methyltransferase YrrM